MIKKNSIFLVDKEKDKSDGKLRYRIKWNGNTVAFNVGYRVEFDKWSNDTQRCKNNTTHGKKKIAASEINKEINRFDGIVSDIFNSMEVTGKILNADEFRNEFNIRNGKKGCPTNDLFNIYDEFTFEMGNTNQWTKATYQKFTTLKNHLKEFTPNLSFENLNEKGLSSYVNFLRDNLDMRNSTILKDLSFLRWFLRWASNKEYNKEKAYLTFSPKLRTSEKRVIFLDWEELMQVYNFKTPTNKPYLSRIRDVFCFCCFTSLRYSDVANLRRTDVFDDYISITTIKTADSLKIELNDYSKEILSRYEGESLPGNLALPVISNQKMNDYLKELCELCGINRPTTITYYKGNQRIDEVYPKYALIGTHAGRRTFICNALMLGVPAQIVMKWTGHSDYKAMKPYIDIADKAKEEAMKVFNKKPPIVRNGD